MSRPAARAPTERIGWPPDIRRRRNRRIADLCHAAAVGDGNPEVVQVSVVNSIDQAMDGELVSAAPGLLNDRRAADIADLLDHVELTQNIDMGGLIWNRIDDGL